MPAISRVIRNIPVHWVGDGFPVRSLFSYQTGNAFDPFLLLDYAGPYEFPAGEARRGVGEHPHRGFETVTIVYQGELEHQDSSGSRGTIGPGDVQWMTAAGGVVHEEFHSEAFTRRGGTLELVQLWVNLPARDKLSRPKYQAIAEGEIPRVELADRAGGVRVIAGEYAGTRGAAQTFTPVNVWDVEMLSGAEVSVRLPERHTALFVLRSGSLAVEGKTIDDGALVQFDRTGGAVSIGAQSAASLLVLTGEPLGEPVVGQGPFVMNTREEIQQAIRDYQSGRMGQLPRPAQS